LFFKEGDMRVRTSRNGNEFVFTRFLIPGRAVARRIVGDDDVSYYELEVTVGGETERIPVVDPSKLDLGRMREMFVLLMAACEHMKWEYEEHPYMF
jgi:hypothetical protein